MKWLRNGAALALRNQGLYWKERHNTIKKVVILSDTHGLLRPRRFHQEITLAILTMESQKVDVQKLVIPHSNQPGT